MTTKIRRTALLSMGVSLALLLCAAAIQAQPDAKGDKNNQDGMMGRMQ